MERNDTRIEVPGIHAYSYEDDVFYARPKDRTYSTSIDLGEFIFDIDQKGKVVGIEILNASKIFHVPKEALRHLISMRVQILVSENKIEMVLQLKASFRNGQTSGSLIVDKEAPEFMQPSTLEMAIA